MKNCIIILGLLLSISTAVCQTKKVAVWEVQAMNESVSGMNKLQVQGAMEKAISNADGFEAYNRNALETIMAEQNFQRGGNVSDEQIREIGKMAGVDYILLIQIAKEGNEVFATANILDIETGRYGDSDNELMNANGTDIQIGCCNLASRLFHIDMICEGSTSIVNSPKAINAPFKKNMVLVQGGTFVMGTEKGSPHYSMKATPAHNVTLSNFYISKYEVTRKQWKDIMGEQWVENKKRQLTNDLNNLQNEQQAKVMELQTAGTARRIILNSKINSLNKEITALQNFIFSQFSEENDEFFPICGVNYSEVQLFLKQLNTKTGQKYRLPTEAEWEYAARGGNASMNYKYSGSNEPNTVCASGETESPIGSYMQNELGLYDMSGNVKEWCSDFYKYKYPVEDQTNPQGPVSGKERVVRGGSYSEKSTENTSFTREGLRETPKEISDLFDVGFRLVLDAE